MVSCSSAIRTLCRTLDEVKIMKYRITSYHIACTPLPSNPINPHPHHTPTVVQSSLQYYPPLRPPISYVELALQPSHAYCPSNVVCGSHQLSQDPVAASRCWWLKLQCCATPSM